MFESVEGGSSVCVLYTGVVWCQVVYAKRLKEREMAGPAASKRLAKAQNGAWETQLICVIDT